MKRSILFSVFLLLFSAAQYSYANIFDDIGNFIKDHTCLGVSIKHSVSPVLTEGAGGSSTSDSPKIQVSYDGCFGVVKISGSKVISAGEATSLYGFTYLAMLKVDTDVCANKNIFGYANGRVCSGGDKCDITRKISCDGAERWPACDYSLTAEYVAACDSWKGKMVGICAYHADLPDALAAVSQFFQGNSWSATVTDAMNKLKSGGGENVSIRGFDMITDDSPGHGGPHCFPVPLYPMPPPFGHDYKVRTPVEILRVCEAGEEPVFLLKGNPEKVCVKASTPSAVASTSPNASPSTFRKTCARIVFKNYKASTDKLVTDSPDGVDPVTHNPLLYQVDKSGPIFRKATVYDALWAKYTGAPTTLYGSNAYHEYEICHDFTSNDNNAISVTDPADNSKEKSTTRTFEMVPGCEQTKTCGTESEVRFKETKVCVREKNKDDSYTYLSCFDRPDMPKPEVTFCDDEKNKLDGKFINQKSNICMKVSVPDLNVNTCQMQISGSKFSTTGDCPVIAGSDNSKAASPVFLFTGTNNCFDAQPKDGACIPYDCCGSSVCPNKGLGMTKDAGTTKLCLFGYSPKMSEPWCQSDCNRICTKKVGNTDSGVPSVRICDRNPIPPSLSSSNLGVLEPGQYCAAGAITAEGNYNIHNSMYRTKNGIENGTCIDMYLFDFADCEKLDKNAKIKGGGDYSSNSAQSSAGTPDYKKTAEFMYGKFVDYMAYYGTKDYGDWNSRISSAPLNLNSYEDVRGYIARIFASDIHNSEILINLLDEYLEAAKKEQQAQASAAKPQANGMTLKQLISLVYLQGCTGESKKYGSKKCTGTDIDLDSYIKSEKLCNGLVGKPIFDENQGITDELDFCMHFLEDRGIFNINHYILAEQDAVAYLKQHNPALFNQGKILPEQIVPKSEGQICKDVVKYCTTSDDKRHYDNFDKCNTAFISCNSGSSSKLKIDGDVIPCSLINKIMKKGSS